jgi:hypothetical protein
MATSEVTITKKFSSAFDPKNATHVIWFRDLHQGTLTEKSVDKILDANPFGISVSKKECLEWVNIQFIIGMKYATSVLEGKAWVPPQKV